MSHKHTFFFLILRRDFYLIFISKSISLTTSLQFFAEMINKMKKTEYNGTRSIYNIGIYLQYVSSSAIKGISFIFPLCIN